MVSAQALVVYHVTGSVLMRSGDKKQAVARGTTLPKNSILELKDGATCMLISQKGQSLQIDKAGQFNTARLQQMLGAAAKSGVSGKFFAYVYNNLVRKPEKTLVNITPVVYRADALMKAPQQYQVLACRDLAFQWRRPASKAPVRFQLFTEKDSVITDTIITQTQEIILPLTRFAFKKNQLYKWVVEDQYNPAKTKNYFYFVLVASSELSSFKQTRKDIEASRHPEEVKKIMRRDLMLQAVHQ